MAPIQAMQLAHRLRNQPVIGAHCSSTRSDFVHLVIFPRGTQKIRLLVFKEKISGMPLSVGSVQFIWVQTRSFRFKSFHFRSGQFISIHFRSFHFIAIWFRLVQISSDHYSSTHNCSFCLNHWPLQLVKVKTIQFNSADVQLSFG